ncbi:hypothetical protein RUND412_001399 [Rhizina undulata]
MTTPTPERKGPWANRVLSTDIERTPEYEEFMNKLAKYHEKRGHSRRPDKRLVACGRTTLTPEPELGRKLLDLSKLYEKVTALGGYDKVTEEKGRVTSQKALFGAWRDLALGYKLVANNTNAGYLLKTIYYKNLAAFEISNFFGKEPPPKEWLEERSAAGGPIMTRTAENFLETSPKAESKGEKSPSPAPTNLEKRNLRQAPTPRTFYSPDTTPQRHNPPRASASGQNQTSNANQQNGISNLPVFQSITVNAPIGRPVATPRNAPHEFVGQKRASLELNTSNNRLRIGAGHQGAQLMTRIAMGLRSGIETEVNFGLSHLVRLSFEYAEDLTIDHLPGIPECLFEKLGSIEALMSEYSWAGLEETMEHTHFTTQLEKINEAALILRNMSFNEDNAKYFSRLESARKTVVMVMNLPNHPNLMELKHYVHDLTESMASHLTLSYDDPLFDALHANLLSDDRGLLLSSLRAICRLLMGRDEFNILGKINKSAIERIQRLLLIDDEDLISACLDFLYQYTANDENVERIMRPPEGVELVRHLVRLLLYHADPTQTTYLLKSLQKPQPQPREIPDLPTEIVNDLLGYTEPERAAKWMRCCFEEDQNADITQIALWQAYQNRFNEYVAQGRPLLPAAEFIKNVSVAFSNASAMVLSMPPGQKFIIKGIKARETPMSIKGHVYLACKWLIGSPTDPNAKCTTQVATPQDLWAHVLQKHLSPPQPGEEQKMLFCRWGACTRFGNDGEKDRRKVVAHVRTHMPDVLPMQGRQQFGELTMEERDNRLEIRRQETTKDDRGDAAGVPLTAALVLRNISRRGNGGCREVVESFREDLYEVMALNKPLVTYVADLLLETGGGTF